MLYRYLTGKLPWTVLHAALSGADAYHDIAPDITRLAERGMSLLARPGALLVSLQGSGLI